MQAIEHNGAYLQATGKFFERPVSSRFRESFYKRNTSQSQDCNLFYTLCIISFPDLYPSIIYGITIIRKNGVWDQSVRYFSKALLDRD